MIKRYGLVEDSTWYNCVKEVENGEYVSYAYHAAELAKVNARLEVAVEALEAIKTPGSGPWQPIEIATEALTKLKEME